jgi:hypothetical protein
LVENGPWQIAILFHVNLMEFLPCQKFALPVQGQNRLGCNKNGPLKRSRKSKVIRRQKWSLNVK